MKLSFFAGRLAVSPEGWWSKAILFGCGQIFPSASYRINMLTTLAGLRFACIPVSIGTKP